LDNKAKILVIDDSPTQRMMIKIFLEKQGFIVVTADNGMEGISKTYSELPNLIISDIVMPELNGNCLSKSTFCWKRGLILLLPLEREG